MVNAKMLKTFNQLKNWLFIKLGNLTSQELSEFSILRLRQRRKDGLHRRSVELRERDLSGDELVKDQVRFVVLPRVRVLRRSLLSRCWNGRGTRGYSLQCKVDVHLCLSKVDKNVMNV